MMNMPSKRFIVFASAILMTIGTVSGVLIQPLAGVFFVLFFGLYAFGFYLFLNNQGALRNLIAIIGIIFFIGLAYFVGQKRKENDAVYEQNIQRIAENQVKPMTMEELNKILDEKQ